MRCNHEAEVLPLLVSHSASPLYEWPLFQAIRGALWLGTRNSPQPSTGLISFDSLLSCLQRRSEVRYPARNSPNGERQCQQEPRKKFS
jgi:hypothetical protein